MSWQRIKALLLRYGYIYRRSPTRMMDIVFWPILELMLWGFVSLYLSQTTGTAAQFIALLVGALILWEVFVRSSIGVTTSFLEDMWTRNFLNLFASPLRLSEFLVAVLLSSLLRVLIAVTLLAVLAAVFYHFNVLTLGLPLAAFYLNLMVAGWSLGVVTIAIILRFGQSAEILAWALAFLLQPFAAVFYPVAILPAALRLIAHAVPLSHVFEGMRAVILQHQFVISELVWATLLNIGYLVVALWFFRRVFRSAKRTGLLVRSWQ